MDAVCAQLYYLNITRPGVLPSNFLLNPTGYYMRAERPKVIYNANTSRYVMWAAADNYNRSLRMAAVATSCWPNGPFTFNRVQVSAYPSAFHVWLLFARLAVRHTTY